MENVGNADSSELYYESAKTPKSLPFDESITSAENQSQGYGIITNSSELEEDRITQEKEADKAALSNITRRKIIYIFVVLLALLAVVFGILMGVFSSQIQTAVNQGPVPPVNFSIVNYNTTDPTLMPVIPQGGMLWSRPYYYYWFSFYTDLVLSLSGTTNGAVLWYAGIPGLNANSGAYLTLTNRGVLQVLDSTGTQILWSNADDYPVEQPEGIYTFQVIETNSNTTSAGQGKIQILNSSGIEIWSRSSTDSSGGA